MTKPRRKKTQTLWERERQAIAALRKMRLPPEVQKNLEEAKKDLVRQTTMTREKRDRTIRKSMRP